MLYSDEDEFLAEVVPFVEEGIAADESVMVAVDERKIGAIRSALNGGADGIQFVDMAALGVNPARIIPAWEEFVRSRDGGDRPIRGVGEPIWPGRGSAELVECHHHESLLNFAFAGTAAFQLVCPYDVAGLPDEVIEEALRTHPIVNDGGAPRRSDAYLSPGERPGPFAGELPAPAATATEMSFDRDRLSALRALHVAAGDGGGARARSARRISCWRSARSPRTASFTAAAAEPCSPGARATCFCARSAMRARACGIRSRAGCSRQSTARAAAACGSSTTCATSCRSGAGGARTACACT